MAPGKFGLFKARSRDQEQPSTENLLHSTHSNDLIMVPSSPIPSTSYGKTEELSPEDFTALQIDSDDEDIPSEKFTPVRRVSDSSMPEEAQVNYHPLRNQASIDATSTSTLQDEDFDHIQYYEDLDKTLAEDCDGASTSCDANSLQFDETSLAASEDLSVYCGTLKKGKKNKYKEEKQMRDLDMWQASNIEVMENLLSRSGSLDDQIKWEAIATARGLCTLTDNCACGDCARAKYLAAVTDGDGGLGAAPLLGTITNLLSRSGTLDEQIKWEAIATARGLCTLTDNCACGDCARAKYLAGVTDGDGGLGAAPLLSAISVGCTIQ